jgi:hypothetical protein
MLTKKKYYCNNGNKIKNPEQVLYFYGVSKHKKIGTHVILKFYISNIQTLKVTIFRILNDGEVISRI